ncbi:unnamed protein product, partial [Rotaria sp. Silwood1]
GVSHGTTICGNGTRGSSLNQLACSSQVPVASNGNIRVADLGNHRIIFYNGTSIGILIGSTDDFGSLNNQSQYPYGIAYDSTSDTLYRADYGNNRVMSYASGASSGSWVAGNSAISWTLLLAGDINGSLGSNATALTYPTDVADRQNHRIQLFINGQTEAITIAEVTDVSGSNSTLFNLPWSVELDSQLNLYVVGSNNHRIQKFLWY